MYANEFTGESRVKSNDGSGLGYGCDACCGWGDGFGSFSGDGFSTLSGDNGCGSGRGSGRGSGDCSGGALWRA